jgi:hypothetical protein
MALGTLDQNLIEFGEDLLKKLDGNQVLVDAALWIYSTDEESWNLFLTFPKLVKKGPKRGYSELLKALLAIPGVNENISYYLDLVTISRSDDPFLKLIRSVFKTGSGISHLRFTDYVIKGQPIKDILIYRLL